MAALRHYFARITMPGSIRRAVVTTVVTLSCWHLPPLLADPSVTSIVPRGINPGQTTEISLFGSGLEGPLLLWSTVGGAISESAAGDAAAGDHARVTLSVPEQAPPGVHGLRLANSQGVSDWQFFLVDDLTSVPETGGNESAESAQPLMLPCAVDGHLDPLTRDFYRFRFESGQTISFEVYARRLGTALDPVLFLYDEEGRELAYADDTEGLGADTQLIHTFDTSGTGVLEIRDVRYSGGRDLGYRLRIGDFPCLHGTFPLCVEHGTRTRIDFAGLSCADADPAWVDVPADWSHDWFPVSTRRSGGSSTAFTTVALASIPQSIEREPNNTPAQANVIAPDQSINGRFDDAGDRDLFLFSAPKGQRLRMMGVTRTAGAPTDLLIAIEDAAGNRLAQVDDVGTNEGSLDFTAPHDGEFVMVLSDLHRRGGSQFTYRVDLEQRRPDFKLTVDADRFAVPVEGAAGVVVTATRQDFDGPIALSVAGVPGGMTLVPTTIGPGQNSARLTLAGASGAHAEGIASLSIIGSAHVEDRELRRVADASDLLKSRMRGSPHVPALVRTSLCAALVPRQPLALHIEPGVIKCAPGLGASVRVRVRREEGFDGDVSLATSPEKDALPSHIKLEIKPIPAGQREVELMVTASEAAALGSYTVGLVGTHKQGERVTLVSAPGLTVHVEPALAVGLSASDIVLKRGADIRVPFSVRRHPALSGEITVHVENLPAGVTAQAVAIPPDAAEGEVVLTADASAPSGPITSALLRVTSVNHTNIQVETGLNGLSVE